MNELWNYPIWKIKTDFNKKFNNDLVDEIYSISQELKNDLNPKDSLWDYHRPNLSILKTKIDSCINTVVSKNITEIKELNYSFSCGMGWVNVKEPGEDIELHAHPDCSFAATYYVKTPENCGDLVCYVKDGKKLRIKPEEGVIVILPFYILHEIEANQSSDLRISISTDFLQIPDKTVKDALVIKSWLHQMVKTKEWNFVN